MGTGRSEGGETVVRIYSMRLKYKVFMYKVQRTNLCFYRGLKQLLLMGERLTSEGNALGKEEGNSLSLLLP